MGLEAGKDKAEVGMMNAEVWLRTSNRPLAPAKSRVLAPHVREDD